MKILLITGLPRGGTSAAAAIAEALGVPMALPTTRAEAAPDLAHRYPRGTVEDTELRALVRKWCGVDQELSCSGFKRQWRDSLTSSEVNELVRWLCRRLDHAASLGVEHLGVKLPAMSSVLAPVAKTLRDFGNHEPIPFFIRRSFEDAVSSLAVKRGVIHEPLRPMIWAQAVQSYNQWHLAKAEDALARLGIPSYSLDFDRIIGDTAAAASTIARRLEIPFNPDAVAAVDRSLHQGRSHDRTVDADPVLV
jgi:hypothetical protein